MFARILSVIKIKQPVPLVQSLSVQNENTMISNNSNFIVYAMKIIIWL